MTTKPLTSWKSSAGVEYFRDDTLSILSELYGAYDARWEMELCERAGLLHVLETARPDVSIEIGTSNGGSLSAIAKHSGHVFTLDLDPRTEEKVGVRYSNVEYMCGDSRVTLPALLRTLEQQKARLGFALVDGGHDSECVRSDLNALLTYQPVRPLWIVMHDSFNPACREGIRTARWNASPYLHLVELDYVPGILHTAPELSMQMWGGLAVALMLPTRRTGAPRITARQEALFELVRASRLKRRRSPWDFFRRS